MEPRKTQMEMKETDESSRKGQAGCGSEIWNNPGFHLGKNRDESSKIGIQYDPKMICRLCAVMRESETDDLYEWIKICDPWLHSSETIDTVMRRCCPNGLMVHIPNGVPFLHICTTCYLSLQQMKIFIDRITKGQEKLEKLLQVQEEGTVKLETDVEDHVHARPKKRGRPRKDANSTTIQHKFSTCIVSERGKRTSRPPNRYGREICMRDEVSDNIQREDAVDTPKMEPRTDANFKFDSLLSNDISEHSTLAREETQNVQSITPKLNGEEKYCYELEKPSKSKDKNQELKYTADSTYTDSAYHSHDNDVNFKLPSYKRSRKLKTKRRPGRPRKIQQNEFQCNVCQKVYTAYASLVYHQLSHQEHKKEFICTLCKKAFAHRALLANHMFTHSSVRPYICDKVNCKSTFKSRGSLYNHKKLHKEDSEKTFTCDKCGLQFSLKASLQAHCKTHNMAKPYSCTYCDKTFNHSGNMKEHIRTHTKEKPYSCNIPDCGKKFATSSQLRNHKMRHLDKKPFLCVDCGKSFSQRAGLVAHMKTHNGGFKACTICHKEFSDSSALIKHQRIHSGERPFQCKICNKAFSDPSNYAKHKRTHAEHKSCTKIRTTSNAVNIDNASGKTSIKLLSTTTNNASSGNSISVVASTLGNDNEGSIIEMQENDVEDIPEPMVQILTQEELTTLNTGVSADNGNIIFIYQPDDLFSITANSTVPAGGGDTAFLVEEETGESSLSMESQEKTHMTEKLI